MKRRDFIKSSAITGGSVALLPAACAPPREGAPRSAGGADKDVASADRPFGTGEAPLPSAGRHKLPDLSPARWIWYPSGRTLPNTFVLFRRELDLRPRRAGPPAGSAPTAATGSRSTASASSGDRRRATRAGRRPIRSTSRPRSRPGRNVLGVTVLFYGHGDGTWPLGKPGFLFWLEIEHADGTIEQARLRRRLARAPGPRLAAGPLQALVSARAAGGVRRPPLSLRLEIPPASAGRRLAAGHGAGRLAQQARPLPPATTSTCSNVGGDPPDTELRPRSIPLLREIARARRQAGRVVPARVAPPPAGLLRVPHARRLPRRTPEPAPRPSAPAHGQVSLDGDARPRRSTFEFAEQIVGWPCFTIEAPAGTIVELLVHEAHDPGGPPLLNTHFDSWTRFICREGVNRFETFDFESLRWLQLHIHGASGPVSDPRRRRAPARLSLAERAAHLAPANRPCSGSSTPPSTRSTTAPRKRSWTAWPASASSTAATAATRLHAVHLAFGETAPARALPARPSARA